MFFGTLYTCLETGQIGSRELRLVGYNGNVGFDLLLVDDKDAHNSDMLCEF